MPALDLLEPDRLVELLLGREFLLAHSTSDDAGVGGGLRLGLLLLVLPLHLEGLTLRFALRLLPGLLLRLLLPRLREPPLVLGVLDALLTVRHRLGARRRRQRLRHGRLRVAGPDCRARAE